MRSKTLLVLALTASFLLSGCAHDSDEAAGLALVGAGLLGVGLLVAGDDDDDRYERRGRRDRHERYDRHHDHRRYHGDRCHRRSYC